MPTFTTDKAYESGYAFDNMGQLQITNCLSYGSFASSVLSLCLFCILLAYYALTKTKPALTKWVRAPTVKCRTSRNSSPLARSSVSRPVSHDVHAASQSDIALQPQLSLSSGSRRIGYRVAAVCVSGEHCNTLSATAQGHRKVSCDKTLGGPLNRTFEPECWFVCLFVPPPSAPVPAPYPTPPPLSLLNQV